VTDEREKLPGIDGLVDAVPDGTASDETYWQLSHWRSSIGSTGTEYSPTVTAA
jgi:hypothetical protein